MVGEILLQPSPRQPGAELTSLLVSTTKTARSSDCWSCASPSKQRAKAVSRSLFFSAIVRWSKRLCKWARTQPAHRYVDLAQLLLQRPHRCTGKEEGETCHIER